jgi:hypothetical protein
MKVLCICSCVYKNFLQFLVYSSKWKPSITPQGASSLYQLVRMESFSIYWNPSCGANGLVTDLVGPGSAPYCWRNEMRRGLETFSINKDDFDFSECPHHHFLALKLMRTIKKCLYIYLFVSKALASCSRV